MTRESKFIFNANFDINLFRGLSTDNLRDESDEEALHVAGLREKRLIALIVWLTVLGILAAVVLIVSLLL
jgi:hypothetical protein